MKKFLFILLTITTQSVFAENYTCVVNSFGKVIEGNGNSENAARVDARLKCVFETNLNPMFCKFKDMQCTQQRGYPMTYCELEAMGKLYYSLSSAYPEDVKKEAAQACMQKNNSMFCKLEDVKCLEL